MDELIRAVQRIDAGYEKIARIMANLEIEQHELLRKVFSIDCAKTECLPCRISHACLMITATSSMWRDQYQEIFKLLEQAGIRLPAGNTKRRLAVASTPFRRAPEPSETATK